MPSFIVLLAPGAQPENVRQVVFTVSKRQITMFEPKEQLQKIRKVLLSGVSGTRSLK